MADPVTINLLPYQSASGADLLGVNMLCGDLADTTKSTVAVFADFAEALDVTYLSSFKPNIGTGAPVDGTTTGYYYFDSSDNYQMYIGVYGGSSYTYHKVGA